MYFILLKRLEKTKVRPWRHCYGYQVLWTTPGASEEEKQEGPGAQGGRGQGQGEWKQDELF